MNGDGEGHNNAKLTIEDYAQERPSPQWLREVRGKEGSEGVKLGQMDGT